MIHAVPRIHCSWRVWQLTPNHVFYLIAFAGRRGGAVSSRRDADEEACAVKPRCAQQQQAQPGAHLQPFELTGGIPLLLHVSIYFALLSPQLGTMSWWAASLSSSPHISPPCVRSCFSSNGAGLVATPEGVGSFVLRRCKGKMKSAERLSVNIRCSV